MKLTLREISSFVKEIGKRRNKDFQLNAMIHGHKIPELEAQSEMGGVELGKESEDKIDQMVKESHLRNLKEKASRIRNGQRN